MLRAALLSALLLAATPVLAQKATTVPNPLQQGSVPADAFSAAPTSPATRARPSRSLPTPTPTPTGAGQFASEAAAQAHCPADVTVWVNPRSKAYHLKGTRYYGHTKEGAYMCRKDADAGGMHGPDSKKATAAPAAKH